ncbi:MAG TPA: HD domain-containing protein [Candidatus Eisenbergiella merdipullorum]|uniref:HD domain-containing protein n=1 Tax=Candidatus Eisenbergiella merdipullorum TaxID=2838553 RepID=A0A9D2KYJ2_9FIRM|nr:HD domain-containing protein [Candidatus Eisenbergiella merdipullorum]
MKIDRKKAADAFREYTEQYDTKEEKVRLKVEHTWRVAQLCERIAQSLGLPEEEQDLAWLIGLLHDVGRFEQLRRYGTFIDSQSIDHAGYGAQILFGEEQRIRDYVSDPGEDALIRTAVACHSAYRIPEGLDERTERFCNILRDADKIDILKVNVDFPLEEIYNVSTRELKNVEVSPEVMEAFYEGHAVLRSLKKTAVDHLIGHVSLVFELVFPVSLKIVLEQGYLERILSFVSDNPVTRKQFAAVRAYMETYLSGFGTEEKNGD